MILRMTIRTRNKIVYLLTIVSLALLLGFALLLGSRIYTGALAQPAPYSGGRFRNFPPARYSFPAVIAAILFFPLYVSAVLLYISVEFEKTQSTEIVYFSGYLVGCLSECGRLTFPIFSLWESYSLFAFFCGRIVLFGRILTPISLAFMSICSGERQRKNVEQNVLMLLITAAVVAAVIPVHTGTVLPDCRVKWGYSAVILTAHILIAAVTVASLIINDFMAGGGRQIPWDVITFMLGYEILCAAVNWLFAAAGAVLISAGTFAYLRRLHSRYLWD